jgi:hypothetical protein
MHRFKSILEGFFKKPYDNFSSLTLDSCDFIIRYENIASDYLLALEKAGIESPKPLPVANKTAGKKNDLSLYYTDDIKEQAIYVFAPFLEKYGYNFLANWGQIKTPISSSIKFKILGFFRKINQKYFKNHSERTAIEGTIYGDMQRRKIN